MAAEMASLGSGDDMDYAMGLYRCVSADELELTDYCSGGILPELSASSGEWTGWKCLQKKSPSTLA